MNATRRVLNALAALSARELDYGRPARPLPVQRRPRERVARAGCHRRSVNSKITSAAPAKSFHLGRPWRGWPNGYVKNGVTYNSRGQVTVRNTELPGAIKDAPWTDMSPNLWTDGRFFEYQNTGPGAGVNANRPQLSDDQATEYTPQKYLAGTDGWNPVG